MIGAQRRPDSDVHRAEPARSKDMIDQEYRTKYVRRPACQQGCMTLEPRRQGKPGELGREWRQIEIACDNERMNPRTNVAYEPVHVATLNSWLERIGEIDTDDLVTDRLPPNPRPNHARIGFRPVDAAAVKT